MNISSAVPINSAANEQQIRVIKSANKQTEAVVGKLIESIQQSSPQPERNTGNLINLKA